jgi:putative membrane protein
MGDYDPHFWEKLFGGLMITLTHGGLGIVLGALSFKIFDKITPRIDVEKELAEKHNVAVAIVCAALILGICYIVASAVS